MKNNTQIKFGTDGWRAVIADDFTFYNITRVAQATADYWKTKGPSEKNKLVIIGYDRRFLSKQFAITAAEVVAANGFKVIFSNEPTPTPAVSWTVKVNSAVGGIMITASHNPPKFNGFKIKAHFGGSADPNICQQVENLVDASPPQKADFNECLKSGIIKIANLKPDYFRALRSMVDIKAISNAGLFVVHDPLFGVGAGCFNEIITNPTATTTVLTINGNHDVNFGGINPEPVPQNYKISSQIVKKLNPDICLVTDGDADRIGGMFGNGLPITTHQIACLLLYHIAANRNDLTNGCVKSFRAVKTITTTSLVDKLCSHFNIQLLETGVGFKYICSEMLKGNVLIGMEESGGIGFLNHIPERDGLLAGLMLLELLAYSGKSVQHLIQKFEKQFGPHRYGRIDIEFPVSKRNCLTQLCTSRPPTSLLGSEIVDIKSFDGVKFIAKNGSWLMLRGSGTEPVLRIYAEAPSQSAVNELLKLGQNLAAQI